MLLLKINLLKYAGPQMTENLRERDLLWAWRRVYFLSASGDLTLFLCYENCNKARLLIGRELALGAWRSLARKASTASRRWLNNLQYWGWDAHTSSIRKASRRRLLRIIAKYCYLAITRIKCRGEMGSETI